MSPAAPSFLSSTAPSRSVTVQRSSALSDRIGVSGPISKAATPEGTSAAITVAKSTARVGITDLMVFPLSCGGTLYCHGARDRHKQFRLVGTQGLYFLRDDTLT